MQSLSGNTPRRDILTAVAARLLVHNELRLDDLAEHFGYSRSSMSRLLPLVSAILAPYRLELDSKAYKGLHLHGREICKRAALVGLLLPDNTPEATASLLGVEGFDPKQALEWTHELLADEQLAASPAACQQFIMLCLVCAGRILTANKVDFSGHLITPSLLPTMDALRRKRLEKIRTVSWLPEALPSSEQVYLTLAFEHTFFDATRLRRCTAGALAACMAIVQAAFHHIKDRYGDDLLYDEALKTTLAEHIAASYGAYLLGLDESNVYTEEVQIRYPLAYYYTLELAEKLSTSTRLPVLPGELGYMTMHIASGLEHHGRKDKVHIAILCSTAFGTAPLLKTRLLQQYGSTINVVGVYSLTEARQNALPVDLYVSTIPVDADTLNGKPLLEVSPFLDEAGVRCLSAAMANLKNHIPLGDYFSPSHFFALDRVSSKEKLLSTMCDVLIREGVITPEEAQGVMAREALVSTEIFPQVALPHCLIRQSSQLSFAVLKQPVLWGKSKVRLVVLGCFQEKDERIKHLLQQLYQILSKEKNVARLLACENALQFAKVLDDCVKGKKPND